uniref:NADH dehydrogenase subunit 6 n=1 Tax=Cichlidogyrus mbirizei TaxID=2094302 RepID=A0A344ANW0_9PLAT|nr:NADH dehydrogenase subunit 6 [Cichlidogyrus mbirizei]
MSILVWLYLASVALLLLSSNVLFYCIVLVLNSLCSILLMFGMSGFAWYALLMYVVYVGGVYILLLFVSIHNPNSVFNLNMSIFWMCSALFISWEFSCSLGPMTSVSSDYSLNFCSGVEGPLYLFLCFFLVLGFLLVSTISGSKESFIR